MPEGFVPNPAGLAELLVGTHGPVALDLTRKALRVQSGARRRCPVDTGRLRSSIRWTIERDAKGLYAEVGTEVEYAASVHNGHKAFVISVPAGAYAANRNTGFIVQGPTDLHIPATQGKPFLRDALQDITGL